MVKVDVLLERLDSQISIALVQQSVESSDKLHTSPLAQPIGRGWVNLLISCSKANVEESAENFCVLGFIQTIGGVEQFDELLLEWCLEFLDTLEEDDDLVCGPTLNVVWGWLEASSNLVECGPLIGEFKADVREGGVVVWLWWKSGSVIPSVPVDLLGQSLGGDLIILEELEDSVLEVRRCKGLGLVLVEVLSSELAAACTRRSSLRLELTYGMNLFHFSRPTVLSRK